MHHVIFQKAFNYPIAVLVKDGALKQNEMEKHYIKPLNTLGIQSNQCIGFNLKYDQNGKAPVKFIKSYLDGLLQALDSLQVTTLYVSDSAYFKVLTGEKKSEPHHGYILPCKVTGYEHMNIILGINYQALFYKPDLQEKLDMSLSTLSNHVNGTHTDLGKDIIHYEYYPNTLSAISQLLNSLHKYEVLTVDIEAFSLQFNKAGIGTIGFAWDQHNGVAFKCDYSELKTPRTEKNKTYFGEQIDNPEVKKLLREFFCNYKGKLIYHNGNYDIKILIYELFMDDLLDQEGLIEGLHIMTNSIEDTKLITYLATNSTAGNNLRLKDNSHEFAGNYAQDDIKDIRLIPSSDLLRYNLTDCLCTWYVFQKYYTRMLHDNQLETYQEIFIPSVKVLLQTELTGMPMNMDEVHKVNYELTEIREKSKTALFDLPVIHNFILKLRSDECIKQNALWVRKQEPLEYFDFVGFNPNSNQQLQHLIFDFMGYEPIDFTDTKQPATGAKTIQKLVHLAKTDEHRQVFEALIALAEVGIIIDTFINAFLTKSIKKADGMWYLHGSFNLGGTVSGRLSSSDPNLQNIPSNSKYAKHIKRCFMASTGWLMCGADFASLEDRISALTTKDPNKLKVYIQGYDGHSLRAYSYFAENGHMSDINPDSVESINSIEDKYPDDRQESKAPTFALTYQGMWKTLVNNLGWSETKAKKIEAKYHELYKVSDEWVQEKLKEATKTGYVTVAFGLRVRTPILAQTMLGKKSTPYEASAEGRTAGNALGQSYGMLNNRANNEFMSRVWNSPYVLDIKPIAQIHDAGYYIVKNELGVIKWFNDNLPDCMAWQKLPEIQHDQVKLSGNVEIYYPSWKDKTTLKNNISKEDIYNLCN